MAWDAAKLPFLEEKLEFRRRFVERLALPTESRVLCLFGGAEARLTIWYAARFQEVVAVDRMFLACLPPNVFARQCEADEYLREAVRKEAHFDLVDVDPYGSPFPILEAVFGLKGLKALLVTDGFLTCLHFRRRVDVYGRYGVGTPGVKKSEKWQERWFECLLFARVRELAQRAGYLVAGFDARRNRYGLALYVGFSFIRRGDSGREVAQST